MQVTVVTMAVSMNLHGIARAGLGSAPGRASAALRAPGGVHRC
jgi:hypothetical protein